MSLLLLHCLSNEGLIKMQNCFHMYNSLFINPFTHASEGQNVNSYRKTLSETLLTKTFWLTDFVKPFLSKVVDAFIVLSHFQHCPLHLLQLSFCLLLLPLNTLPEVLVTHPFLTKSNHLLQRFISVVCALRLTRQWPWRWQPSRVWWRVVRWECNDVLEVYAVSIFRE